MDNLRIGLRTLSLATLLFLAGCHRSEPPQFVLGDPAKKLSTELQHAVSHELIQRSGTFLKPRMMPIADEAEPDLARGQAVFQERCEQCHGVTGDGNGPTAKYMYPRPRDYRKGLFKFTSTPYGFRPTRDDLMKTIRQGIRGTSMPGFNLLPEKDLLAVVDYVIMLSRRGELEQLIVSMAESDDAVAADEVESDLVPIVLKRWSDADGGEVLPETPQPKFTAEHVARGKAAFLAKGCSKCHGVDGRGLTYDNRGTDAWGRQTRAADLTSGMLHGGNRPIDIYRRIHNGINGTPMPGFATVFADNPQAIWDVVAYVLTMTDLRRKGQIPSPGPINPYVSAASNPKPSAP